MLNPMLLETLETKLEAENIYLTFERGFLAGKDVSAYCPGSWDKGDLEQ